MSDRPWVLLGLPPLPPKGLRAYLGELPVDLVVPERRDPAAVRAALGDVDLVLADWSGELGLDAAAFAAAPYLAFVQQPNVGVERIDLAAAGERGVPVANTAGANAVSVAEWCLGATLSLLRMLPWADAEVRAGRWPQLDMVRRGSAQLAGRRVGIVGFGPIGRECARRFGALGTQVSYWSRRRRPAEEEHGATYRELDDLVASSDVLVVVVALGEQTRGLLSGRRLALMPEGACVVDAARGGIVDEAAVAAAVGGGRLRGAAFDVFADEPLPAGSPLRGLERVLLSPHAAATTSEAIANVVAMTRANLQRALAGEPVQAVCNGADPVVRRRR